MIATETERPAGEAEERAPPPPTQHRTLMRSSAISQRSVDVAVAGDGAGDPLNRSRLAPTRSASESQSSSKKMPGLRRTKNSSIESTVSLPSQKSLDKRRGGGAGGGGLRHQKAVTAASEAALPTQPSISDDRKALRDALYQGIFSRHRRTIFAVGSFLRMLRSKNSNYDSIRSDSDEI